MSPSNAPGHEVGFLTTQQVAERLQVSAATVRRLVKDGRLSSCKLGHRTFRYRAEEVEAALLGSASPSEEPTDPEMDAAINRAVQETCQATSRKRGRHP
jgi:excisionase family DNA binding protein